MIDPLFAVFVGTLLSLIGLYALHWLYQSSAAEDEKRWRAEIDRLRTEVERLSRPATWQDECAAVEAAFERSGVQPTWPDDEPGGIGLMAAAMAAEITRLRDEVARMRMTDAKPIAWQVTDSYGPIGAAQWMDGETRWPKNQSVSLYLTPQPTLTDAERDALERLCEAVTEYAADDRRVNGERFAAGDEAAVAVVRGFLARRGGER